MREWWSWRGRLAVDGSALMAHVGLFLKFSMRALRVFGHGFRRGEGVSLLCFGLDASMLPCMDLDT